MGAKLFYTSLFFTGFICWTGSATTFPPSADCVVSSVERAKCAVKLVKLGINGSSAADLCERATNPKGAGACASMMNTVNYLNNYSLGKCFDSKNPAEFGYCTGTLVNKGYSYEFSSVQCTSKKNPINYADCVKIMLEAGYGFSFSPAYCAK